MLRVFQAETGEHEAQLRTLFWEYLQRFNYLPQLISYQWLCHALPYTTFLGGFERRSYSH